MFDLSGFWVLFKLNYFCLLLQNLFVVRKLILKCFISFFFLQFTIVFVNLFVSWCAFQTWCATLVCDAVVTPSVFRLWMSHLLYSGTNDAHILFDIGEVERKVKLQKSVSDVTDNIKFWKKKSVFGRICCSHFIRYWRSRKKC